MRRAWISGLVMLWLLTTGSSCETTGQANGLTIESADGGVVIMLVVVAGYCLLDTERCGGGEPTPLQKVQATFESGVQRYQQGDPTGLQWVCLSAHQGYAKAQYFYGAHLFRRDSAHPSESIAWLERAGAQGHTAANFLLRQIGGQAGFDGAGPVSVPTAVAPPALVSCVTGQRVLEAGGGAGEASASEPPLS
jgi:hypothetical protein